MNIMPSINLEHKMSQLTSFKKREYILNETLNVSEYVMYNIP